MKISSIAITSEMPLARAMRMLSFVLMALVLGACAPAWVVADKTNLAQTGEGPGGKSGFRPPEGWLVINVPAANAVVLSKDGEGVQNIRLVQATPEKIFPRSKINVPANVSAQDLAAAFQAEFKVSSGGADIQVKSVSPLDISGLPGFRTHLAFRDSKGAPREAVIVGAQRAGEIFYTSFQALAIHYFKRDLPVFENLITTIRFR